MCAIERPDGFRWHVVLGVCLALREAALGSAGFNQQHHLLFLRVIGAQWAPSARLPSTSATPTPLLTAWCPMYLHCLSCTHNWYSMCSPQLCLFKLEKHLVLTHIGTMDVESWLLLNLLMQILYLEPKWVNSMSKYNIDTLSIPWWMDRFGNSWWAACSTQMEMPGNIRANNISWQMISQKAKITQKIFIWVECM